MLFLCFLAFVSVKCLDGAFALADGHSGVDQFVFDGFRLGHWNSNLKKIEQKIDIPGRELSLRLTRITWARLWFHWRRDEKLLSV